MKTRKTKSKEVKKEKKKAPTYKHLVYKTNGSGKRTSAGYRKT